MPEQLRVDPADTPMTKPSDDAESKDSILGWSNDVEGDDAEDDEDSVSTKRSGGGSSFLPLPFRRDSFSMVDHSSISSSFPPLRSQDDFLMMEVQVDSATTISESAERNEDSWGLLDDRDDMGGAGLRRTSVPSRPRTGVFAPSPPNSPRKTTPTSTRNHVIIDTPFVSPLPPPSALYGRRCSGFHRQHSHSIGPVPWLVSSSSTPSTPLPVQFRRAKWRFALSMQRSDQTRSIVRDMFLAAGPSSFRQRHAVIRRRVYRCLLQQEEEEQQQRRTFWNRHATTTKTVPEQQAPTTLPHNTSNPSY